MSTSCFFHVDLDAFFASVEQLDNPEYKNKAVIVGSLPSDRRGVVSTCSYEARQYGIHSAMPIGIAFQLCPSAVFLRGRMKRYHEKSREVMTILQEFSPEVQQMSIDEAFMDMSGTERLFGSPESAAKRLKEQVLRQTGLTLSIGAASNKYIAKIASGISKPDGLYIVKNGDEETFMLSLPLKKIWGIGEKTLARINKAGFKTVSDIHKASLNLLQGLFGSCTGGFLYHAVRGSEVETFDTQTKSRSLSSEHTFSFDLTDLYTIETALLELSWELMHRLLTEGWNSRTVHVKIRYEDFTTVSVQETSERIFSSADDLYNRAKKLFRKKYENGRGIRLLGIGAQNLENSNTPVQSELFDFGEKKKAAVEKAVINLQKKNPDLRIEKARLLYAKDELQTSKTPAQKIKPKQIISVFFLLAACALYRNRAIAQVQINAQGATQSTPQSRQDTFNPKPFFLDSPVAIFSFTPDSPELEFYARGSWEAKLQTWFGLSSSGKQSPVFSFSPPVFIQKTDLTVWFFLQKKWYFEAAVADDYEKSTVAAGYYGENFLRHARVGNRGINFTRIYGIDSIGKGAGGGAEQAPGITAHWENSAWQADALIRYDMLETFEKKWAGLNELGEKKIGLHKWQRGLRFVLPKGAASFVASVYVESDNGKYKDTQQYTYTKLSPSDYLILNSSDTLILAKPASGRVLVDFYSSDGGQTQKNGIANTLGNFSSEGSSGSFLKDTQDWFDVSLSVIKLQNYSYPDSVSPVPENFFTQISENLGGEKVYALIVQYPPFFSPFADSSLYALSSGLQSTQTSVVSASGIEQKSYGTLIADENSYGGAFGATDFFAKRSQYIRLFKRNLNSSFSGALQAAERYPAVEKEPFIYLTPEALTGNGGKEVLFILVQTSATQQVLDIGTQAVPGSIVMYRNGIKETLFRYDDKTGIVHPFNPPLAFDNIRIIWQQYKEGAQTGRLSAAAGIQKQLKQDLAFDVSASLLWPLTQKDSFSLASSTCAGSLSTAIKFDWKKQDFSLENTCALSFEVPDTTGVRRVLGMDGSRSKKILLTEKADAGFPDGIVPELKRRPKMTTPFSPPLGTKIDPISAETLRTPDTDGYAVRINWRIGANEWLARTIDFKGTAASLASAQEFSIWLKGDFPLSPSVKIYLQLGVSENQSTDPKIPVPTWCITETSPTTENDVKTPFKLATPGSWQKVSVYLRDEDRLQLARSQNARLIIQTDLPLGSPILGTLWIGAVEIGTTSFALDVPHDCLLRSAETQNSPAANTADMLRFNQNGENSVQFFEWNIPPAVEKTVRAYRYMEAVPFSSYDALNFFIYVKETENTALELKFESEGVKANQTILALTIENEGMGKIKEVSLSGGWQKAVFDLHNQKLSVNGVELNADEVSVSECNTAIAPNRMDILFTQDIPSAKGSMYIDEVHLTGKDYRLNVENIFAFDWSKSGTLLSVKGFPLAANPQFTTNINSNAQSGNLNHKNQKIRTGMHTDSRISAQIAGIETSVAAAFSVFTPDAGARNGKAYNLQSASHSLHTTPVFFVTRLLSASEEYFFAPQSGSSKKNGKITLDFSHLRFPLSFSFKTEGNLQSQSFKQDVLIDAHYGFKKEKIEYMAEMQIQALQRGQKTQQTYSDYFVSWMDVSRIQFSDGQAKADKRNTVFSLNQGLSLFEKHFEPQIRIRAQNVYSNAARTQNTSSDRSVFSLPFNLKHQQFSLDWTKKSSVSDAVEKGGFYARDASLYTRWMNKRVWAYAALPVYDFFDDKLPRKMQGNGMALSSYESLWEFSWKRQLFASQLDFIIPSRCSFSTARGVHVSSADTSDTLQFKTTLSFTSFNNFGRFGSKRLFTWYEQDEMISSISFTYKTDKNKTQNYRLGISGYSQFMVYFSQKDKLRFYTEYRTDSESGWKAKFETLWDRTGTTSIVKDAFAFLFSKLTKDRQTVGNIRRQDSFSASLWADGTRYRNFSQNYGIRHAVEFEVNAYLKTSVFLGTQLSFSTSLFALKNNAGVSAKIYF